MRRVLYYNIGIQFRILTDLKNSNDFLSQAIPLLHQQVRTADEALAAFDIGQNHYDLRQFEKAAEFYDKSLGLFQELKDNRSEAAGPVKPGFRLCHSGRT